MKAINLNTLGNEMKVVNPNGELIASVMVFGMKEVLEKTVGYYDERRHGDFDNYLRLSNELLTGKIEDPYSIYWHTWKGENFNLEVVVRDCVRAGCKNIIVEKLPDVPESNESTMVF